MKRFGFVFLLMLIAFSFVNAQIRLASVYGDHMVLQQQSSVPIWGWAIPNQNITIKASWNDEELKTKVDAYGRWKSTLQTPKAGGPFTISVKTNYEVVLKDVMVGEVWLCSGQSNMEWSLISASEGAEEIPKANYPNIRLFNVSKSAAASPQIRGEGQWAVCSPESARYFSAVGYFFGKNVYENINVPVGLINASWGGTPAEAWIYDSLITNNLKLLEAANKLQPQPWGPQKPGMIYNSMIYPLIPFQIAGVLWYQGEANTPHPFTYKETMETLIKGWRQVFNKEFPFYYVQIAPFNYGRKDEGLLVRDQQTQMLSIPKTGMVVVSDVVENVDDIHPKSKRPVGERLANYALAETYGKKDVVYKSPLYHSMKIEKGKIRVQFENCVSGLISKGGEPTEFMIAGEDQKFVPATAKIDGCSVLVSSKEVKNPVAVRFGWSNGSIPNLFSKEGLPVPSFRTDNWVIELH